MIGTIADAAMSVADGIADIVARTTPERMFRRANRHRRRAQRLERRSGRLSDPRRADLARTKALDHWLIWAGETINAFRLKGIAPPETVVRRQAELLAARVRGVSGTGRRGGGDVR